MCIRDRQSTGNTQKMLHESRALVALVLLAIVLPSTTEADRVFSPPGGTDNNQHAASSGSSDLPSTRQAGTTLSQFESGSAPSAGSSADHEPSEQRIAKVSSTDTVGDPKPELSTRRFSDTRRRRRRDPYYSDTRRRYSDTRRRVEEYRRRTTPAPTSSDPTACVPGFAGAEYVKCNQILENGGTQCQTGPASAVRQFLLKDGAGCTDVNTQIGAVMELSLIHI
eukprot:TRINITY_DN6648_c0_g1_i1.p1 TRINITY_DN6648_c0_g1~~TRINITY_DN6648_c0_g1_i1.p1  ORF type:complete len:224 (-),score=40.52 TRINITY_DN6648_c0_g1_i1:109-780(-)